MTAKKTPKQAFPTEWKGGHSTVRSQGVRVARDQAEWNQIWQEAYGNTFPIPATPKLPAGKMAVAIFAGQSSSAVEVNISHVTVQDAAALQVTYNINARPTMLCVMSEAFILKWIDKTDDNVVFTQAAPPAPSISVKNRKPQ